MNNWTSQIDSTTDKFLKHFGALNNEELNWKPNVEAWSIAQNIDHLITTNRSYFPVLSDLRSGNYKRPFVANFGFLTSFFGKIILNSVKPDRKKKIKTFPVWEPVTGNLSFDVLEKFSKHQAKLKLEIELTEELIETGAVISSPANKNIVYKLQTAFDIIVTHEERHLEQAKEVLDLLKKESSHSSARL